MTVQLTTRDIARRVGIHPSRVRRLAIRYGVGTKVGRDYFFTMHDYKVIEAKSTGKVGRPAKDVRPDLY